MNPLLPARLRNALAGLLLEAIGERSERVEPRIAAAAIVLLKAFGDLAPGPGGTVSLRALRARAHRVAPQCTDDLELGIARLYPEYLERRGGSAGTDEVVSLRSAIGPHAPLVHSRASAYTGVLLRAAAMPPLPHEPAGRGIAIAALLFNAGLYFEVHEVLECVWRVTVGNVKTFTQGLLQVAVALHHAHTGNPRGAWTLLRKGETKLRRTAAAVPAVDIAELLTELVPWERYLANAATEDSRPLAASSSPDPDLTARPQLLVRPRLRLPPYTL